MMFDHQSSDNDQENYEIMASIVEGENKSKSIAQPPVKLRASFMSKQLTVDRLKCLLIGILAKLSWRLYLASQVLILVANKKQQISFFICLLNYRMLLL